MRAGITLTRVLASVLISLDLSIRRFTSSQYQPLREIVFIFIHFPVFRLFMARSFAVFNSLSKLTNYKFVVVIGLM